MNATIEMEMDDPATDRWIQVRRAGRRVEIRAGATRLRRFDQHRRRVTTTVWEVAGTPTGPIVNLVEPIRRSAAGHAAGTAADLEALFDLSGADDPAAAMSKLTELIRTALDYPANGPGRRHGLAGVLTGATYPLLDASMSTGTEPPPTVPPSVAPYLRAGTAREAAHRAFGRRANRPVVRALAHSLTSEDGGPPALEPLCTAVLGTTVLPSERIAEILRARPAHPGAAVLAAREVSTGQALLGRLHPSVAHRLLVESLENPAGAGLLIEALTRWALVGHPDPPQRVRSLWALTEAFADLPLTLDPQRPTPAETAPAETAPAEPEPEPEPAPAGAAVRDRLSFDSYPADIRAIHGQRVGPYRVDVPPVADTLLGWGREMENCLGAYRQAVVSGASHVIGFRDRHDCLVYAVELSRDRMLRQFEGVRASVPPDADAALIVRYLQRSGVLSEQGARRRPGRQLAPPA